jgi:HAE1 family hydrophobic/amphiphilic exporter-1
MFSKFFINRPIFATVLALLIVVAGLVTLNILPVAQFPEITPPTVQVSAVYPGANAETVAQTVGIPIEQQVNGVDGMLYMSSNSSSSGAYSLTITFAVGTDIDMATVQVQNRVSIAQSSLPEPVVVQGVTVQKQSSNIVMFLTMTSQDSVYNSLYLTNYAKPADTCARSGCCECYGSGGLFDAHLARSGGYAYTEYFTATGLSVHPVAECGSICRIYRSTYRAG